MFEMSNYFVVNGKIIFNKIFGQQMVSAALGGVDFSKYFAFSSSSVESATNILPQVIKVIPCTLISYNADSSKGVLYAERRVVITDGDLPPGSIIGSIGLSDGTYIYNNAALGDKKIVYSGGDITVDLVTYIQVTVSGVRLLANDNPLIKCMLGVSKTSDYAKIEFETDSGNYPAVFGADKISIQAAAAHFERCGLCFDGIKAVEVTPLSEITVTVQTIKDTMFLSGNYTYSYGDILGYKVVSFDSTPTEVGDEFLSIISGVNTSVTACGDYCAAVSTGDELFAFVDGNGLHSLNTEALRGCSSITLLDNGDIAAINNNTLKYFSRSGDSYQPLTIVEFCNTVFDVQKCGKNIVTKESGGIFAEYAISKAEGVAAATTVRQFTCDRMRLGSKSGVKIAIKNNGTICDYYTKDNTKITLSGEIKQIVMSRYVLIEDNYMVVPSENLAIYDISAGEKVFTGEANAVSATGDSSYFVYSGDTFKVMYVDYRTGTAVCVGTLSKLPKERMLDAIKVGKQLVVKTNGNVASRVYTLLAKDSLLISPNEIALDMKKKVILNEDAEVKFIVG